MIESRTEARPRPAPADADGLADRSATVASGTVAGASIIRDDIALGDGLHAARVDVVIELKVDRTIKTGSAERPSSWRISAWIGDPVLADAVVEQLREELGAGPIGAATVLFGNPTDLDGGATLRVIGGVVQDRDTAAPVGPTATVVPADLSSVERTLASLAS